MSLHATLMRTATDVLVAVQGDAGAAEIRRPKLAAFVWDVILGAETGGEAYSDNGDLMKVIRLSITGPTAQLVARGMLELERNAKVVVSGREWAIELATSQWGPSLVRLGLVRRAITRNEELEDRAVVR